MPGVKGKTNNPNGRPKGALSKLTGGYRENIVNFLKSDFSKFEESMNNLFTTGKYIEYVRAYIDLMKYGISPAQAPKEDDGGDEGDELRDKIIQESRGA